MRNRQELKINLEIVSPITAGSANKTSGNCTVIPEMIAIASGCNI